MPRIGAPGGPLHRRSDREAPTLLLPASGFDGPVPDPPSSLPADLVDAYRALWASPMGAAWTAEEAPIVAQYASLRRLVDETLGRGEFPPGTALSRMTSIEDRLLLSPKARAAAHVRFISRSSSDEAERSSGTDYPEDVAEKLAEWGLA